MIEEDGKSKCNRCDLSDRGNTFAFFDLGDPKSGNDTAIYGGKESVRKIRDGCERLSERFLHQQQEYG